MDLLAVALDFYDRNCRGCVNRLPVRLPNLYTELVTKRDEARSRAEESERQASQQTARALEARVARRSELSTGCDPAIAGIFVTIDELDRDPTEERRKVLLETARTVPNLFDSRVQEALFELAEAGGFSRTESAIEVLDAVPADDRRLCASALRALARGDGVFISATVVAKHLDNGHADLLQPALPTLIRVAAPTGGFVPFSGSPGKPEAIVAAYRLFPDLVVRAVRNELGASHKYQRIKASEAAAIIARVDPSFGLKIADALVSSLELPDDHYGEEGSAENSVTLALAQIMLDHPDQVDALVQREGATGSERLRTALFRVYENILRFRRLPEGHAGTKAAQELAYRRFVELLLKRPDHELLTEVIWFLRDEAKRFPHLLEQHAETLLGAAALIATELDTPNSPLLDLDPRPDPLKAFEKEARWQCLHHALGAVVEALGVAAARKPEPIGKLVVGTLESLDPQHDYLRAALVESLGWMARNLAALPTIVPFLYQAMMSPSTRVRAAAARAYAEIAKNRAEDLPPLVHESFLLLLMDPYVAVHSAAINTLREVSLPEAFTPRVLVCLINIIFAYRQSRSDDAILSLAIQRFLDLAGPDLPQKACDVIVSVIDGMTTSAATDIVISAPPVLRGASKYGELLIKLISDPETSDYHVDDLLDELEEISPQQILAVSDQIKGAARSCASEDIDITDDLVAILGVAGAWPAAAEIARQATERLSDDTWDRPRKLRSAVRQVAAEIEAAAASSDPALVAELAKRWRELKQKAEKDDEENKEKRSPLPGLRMPGSSN